MQALYFFKSFFSAQLHIFWDLCRCCWCLRIDGTTWRYRRWSSGQLRFTVLGRLYSGRSTHQYLKERRILVCRSVVVVNNRPDSSSENYVAEHRALGGRYYRRSTGFMALLLANNLHVIV